jgi:hypothetical protein
MAVKRLHLNIFIEIIGQKEDKKYGCFPSNGVNCWYGGGCGYFL